MQVINSDNHQIPELSLIVPTYNEKGNVPALLERVHKALGNHHYEVIIVDDNSPDGTAEVARSLAGEYPVRVICRKDEKGLASAVVAGFNQAQGKVLGVIDADLQHPPEEVANLLREAQNGADVVVASRYVSGGGVEGWSLTRKIISKVATTFGRVFLPSARKVTDPMSGFFLLRREVIEGVELKPIGYKILLEVLVRGNVGTVKEVPYTFRERSWGESNLNLEEQVNYLKHVFRLAGTEKEIKRLVKFGIVGLSGVGVNMGTFWVLTRGVGLYDLVALIFGIEASIVSNFILNDIWTFSDRRFGRIKSAIGRALKFNLVSIGAIVIYYATYTPLTRELGVKDMLALLIAIGLGVVWNFGVNSLWTWERGKK